MFLDLIVGELEHLETVRERRLSRLCFCKVIGHLLVRKGLFDVLVVEVDDSVAIREAFALDSVVEDDFLFAALVHALDLAIVTDNLLNDLGVGSALGVILLRELKAVVLLFLGLLLVQAIADFLAFNLFLLAVVLVVLLVMGVFSFLFCDLKVILRLRGQL